MRALKIAVILLAVTGLAIGVVLLVTMRKSSTDFTMPDGSILHIEKVSFGQRDPNFLPGSGWLTQAKEKLAKLIPARLKGNVRPGAPSNRGSFYMNARLHTNSPSLHIWMTKRKAGTRDLLGVTGLEARIVDEHGCVFRSSQNGGESFGLATGAGASVGGPGGSTYDDLWFTFESFPRHQTSFLLRVLDSSSTNVVEFKIQNPAPIKPPEKWAVADLPITRTLGDLSVTLTKMSFESNKVRNASPMPIFFNDPWVVPAFEFKLNGQPTKKWSVEILDLSDSSGNFSPNLYTQSEHIFLCNREDAWKLNAKFFADDHLDVTNNSSWKISGIKVPAAGEITSVNLSGTIAGFTMTLNGICGPGQVVFSNGIPVANTVVSNLPAGPRRSGSGWGSNRTESISSRNWQFGLAIPKLPDDLRLSIRAVDDRAREIYAETSGYGGSPGVQNGKVVYLNKYPWEDLSYCSLRLPPDSKTIELIFCLHQPVTAEFVFKPPQK